MPESDAVQCAAIDVIFRAQRVRPEWDIRRSEKEGTSKDIDETQMQYLLAYLLKL
jgi:hypothetical protein